MKRAAMAGLAVVLVSGMVGCGYEANLTTGDVVPPTALRASGNATFSYDEDTQGLEYDVSVDDIENVTGSAVYLGRQGEKGEKVLDIYSGKKEGIYSDRLAKGTAMASDLSGPLNGHPMSELVQAFDEDRAYIIVTNEEYPNAAIRGQISDKPWYKFW